MLLGFMELKHRIWLHRVLEQLTLMAAVPTLATRDVEERFSHSSDSL